MSDKNSDSGSNTGVVIFIAVLVLAIPCCGGGVALFGLAWVGYRSQAQPAQVNFGPPPVQMPKQAMPPMIVPEAVPEEAALKEDISEPQIDPDPTLHAK